MCVIELTGSYNASGALSNTYAEPVFKAHRTGLHSTDRITRARLVKDSSNVLYLQIYIAGGVNSNTWGKSVLDYQIGAYSQNVADSGSAAMFAAQASGLTGIRTLEVDDNAICVNSGSHKFYSGGNSQERLTIDSGGGMRLQKSDGNGNFTISRNASVTTTNQTIGVVDFASNTAHTVQARIGGRTLGTSNVGGDLIVETRAEGGSLDERFRITGSGGIESYSTSDANPNFKFRSDDANWHGYLNQTVHGSTISTLLSCAGSWTVDGSTYNATKDYNGSFGTLAMAIHNQYNGGAGGFVFLNKNGGSSTTDGSVSELLRIQSTGVVNIGDSTASSLGDRLLQVGKTDRSGTYIELRTSTSGVGGIVMSDGTASNDSGYRGTIEYAHGGSHSDSMYFKTAAGERLRIMSGGSVNIGGDLTQTTHKFLVDNGTTLFKGRVYVKGSLSLFSTPFGANVTLDTGISVNAGGYGGSILALCSRNYGAGTNTQAALYFIKFHYDGDHSPTKYYITGTNDFATFSQSASHTLTVAMGASNNMFTVIESSVI